MLIFTRIVPNVPPKANALPAFMNLICRGLLEKIVFTRSLFSVCLNVEPFLWRESELVSWIKCSFSYVLLAC
jgi:hypothetical protein